MKFKSTDIQIENLFTYVVIENSIFNNINSLFSSLIITEQDAKVDVKNSTFYNIHTYETGAVLFAEKTATEVNFYNTAFRNNSALSGGLFHVESESVIRCYNCTITN